MGSEVMDEEQKTTGLEQIETIADLCDYLDKYAKPTLRFSEYGTNRIEFRL